MGARIYTYYREDDNFLAENFYRFERLPVKARMLLIQKTLKGIGFNVDETGLRDKKTVKAICKLQEDHGFVPNGIICQYTFSLLNIKNIK